MKKLIVGLFAAMLILTACSSGSGGKDDSKTAGNLLHDFQSYIETAEDPADVKEYLDGLMAEMKEADTATADALVLEYLNYMERALSGDQSDPVNFPEKAGFKIIAGEGEYPVIDYRFIDAYAGQVSQEITDFAEFMALNSDKPWAMDGGVIIPIRDLADRVAQGEQFMVRYPDSVMRDKVKTQFEYYLRSFLAGLDNTPLFPFENYKADPEFFEAYNYFLNAYPNLETAETVRGFQTELEQMNYTAPYTYSEYEKRAAFMEHIDELVSDTVGRIIR